jgi:hypothetical protein
MSMIFPHNPALETIAHAWIKTGIQAFGLWIDDHYHYVWPTPSRITTVEYRAPLIVNGQMIGELHLAGSHHANLQERLNADAALLAAVLQYQHTVQLLTDELIDCQDQLVTLYDIWASMGQSADLSTLMQSLMREVVRLTKTTNAWISFGAGLGFQQSIIHGVMPISESILRSIQTNQLTDVVLNV